MPAYQNVSIQFGTLATLTAATEGQVLDSGRVAVSMPTMRAIVTALASVALAAGCTQLTAKIHRGAGIGGATLQTSTINTTASTQQDISIGFSEQLLNADFAEYTFSLAQVGAGTNATVAWALLRVDLING